MEFAVYDLNKDAVEISVFDKDLFSPNGKKTVQFASSIICSCFQKIQHIL